MQYWTVNRSTLYFERTDIVLNLKKITILVTKACIFPGNKINFPNF